MPSWGIHMLVAIKLSPKLKVDRNSFIFGNIVPDINNGYVVKGISKIVKHEKTHFDSSYSKRIIENLEENEFLIKYKNKMNNPIVLGYLAHMLTDRYFNYIAYKKRAIYDKENNVIGIILNNKKIMYDEFDEIRKVKVNDFKIFSKYIYDNKLVKKLEYNKEFVIKNELIEEVEIDKKDVGLTIKYINDNIQGTKDILKTCKELEYKIFTQEELIKITNDCCKFILEYINKNI